MASIGKLLKNRRAGQAKLLWNRPNLNSPNDLDLTSADFEHESHMPVDNASTMIGGKNLSPAFAWKQAPEGASALLLVIADVDVPLPVPITHVAALLDPALTELPRGGLNSGSPAQGVRLLKTTLATGYQGPAPIKGHGPHRYVTQLFAVSGQFPTGERVSLKAVLAAVDHVVARGRLDGLYERH